MNSWPMHLLIALCCAKIMSLSRSWAKMLWEFGHKKPHHLSCLAHARSWGMQDYYFLAGNALPRIGLAVPLAVLVARLRYQYHLVKWVQCDTIGPAHAHYRWYRQRYCRLLESPWTVVSDIVYSVCVLQIKARPTAGIHGGVDLPIYRLQLNIQMNARR